MPKAKKVKVGDEMKASNHNDLVEDIATLTATIATLTATIAEFEARVSVLEGNVTPAAKSKVKAVKE